MEKSSFIWEDPSETTPEPDETLLLLVEQPQPDGGSIIRPLIGNFKNGGYYSLDGEVTEPVAWWSAFAWPDPETTSIARSVETGTY